MFQVTDLPIDATSFLAIDVRAAFRRACEWFDDPSNPTFYLVAGVGLVVVGIIDGLSRAAPRRKL